MVRTHCPPVRVCPQTAVLARSLPPGSLAACGSWNWDVRARCGAPALAPHPAWNAPPPHPPLPVPRPATPRHRMTPSLPAFSQIEPIWLDFSLSKVKKIPPGRFLSLLRFITIIFSYSTLLSSGVVLLSLFIMFIVGLSHLTH